MAESIVKLALDTKVYDANIKKAREGLLAMEKAVEGSKASFIGANKNALEYVKALGSMETTSRSVKGKINELTTAFTDLKAMYGRLTDSEKQSPFGQAMSQSLEQLKSRIKGAQTELGKINEELNGTSKAGGGTGNMLNDLAGKFGLNVKSLVGWGAAIGAGKVALDTMKESLKTNADFMDEFNRTTEGAKAVLDGFLTSIGNGNIKAFFENWDGMNAAGRAFAQAIDDANTAHNTMNSAMETYRGMVDYCNIKLRDPSLSGEERKLWIDKQNEALSEQLRLAKEIAQADINRRNAEFDRNFKVASGGTTLTEKQKQGYEAVGSDGKAYWQKLAEQYDAKVRALQKRISAGSENVMKNGAVYNNSMNSDAIAAQMELDRLQRSLSYKNVMAYKTMENQGLAVDTSWKNRSDQIQIDLSDASAELMRNRATAKANAKATTAANKEGTDLLNAANAQAKVDDYKAKIGKAVTQAENDIEQQRINAMQDGAEKTRAQIELNYKKLIDANKQLEAEWVKALQDNEKQEWLAANPGATNKEKAEWKPTKTVDDLSEGQKNALKAFAEQAEQYKKKATDELVTPISQFQLKLKDLQAEQSTALNAEEYARIEKEIKAINKQMDEFTGKRKTGFNDQSIGNFTQELNQQLATADYGPARDKILGQIADANALSSLLQQAVTLGIDTTDFGNIWQRIFGGEDIANREFQKYVDLINENLKRVGKDPIKLNFVTGNTEQGKGNTTVLGESGKIVSGLAGIQSSLQQMGIEIPQGIQKTIGILQGIMGFTNSIVSIITAIQALSTVQSIPFFHTGGIVHAAHGWRDSIVPGNNFSDGIPAMLSSQEVVLNAAQAGNLASQLTDQSGGGNGMVEGRVSGEDIIMIINNAAARRGWGRLKFA